MYTLHLKHKGTQFPWRKFPTLWEAEAASDRFLARFPVGAATARIHTPEHHTITIEHVYELPGGTNVR